MSASLKSFKDTMIKVKTNRKTLEYQVLMEQLKKELPEEFDEKRMFYEWVDSIEASIKKGEKHANKSIRY